MKNQFGVFDINEKLKGTGWSIEGKYTNAHKRHVFICPKGHRHNVPWEALRLSFFCKECSFNVGANEVKKLLENTEWMLDDEVKNGLYKIKCRSGHCFSPIRKCEIEKKISRNPKCSECKKENTARSITSIFEEQGWTILEKYKGYHVPILCSCPAGHKQMKRPSGLIAGKGCDRCAGLVKKSDEEIQKAFGEFGWAVIGKYINTSTPIECVCPRGHVVKKSLDCLKISPKGCVVCSGQVPIHSLEKRRRRNERVKNYRKWSPLILAGDEHKCVICGSTDGLNAHHLNSYHKDIDKRYDLDNGVSLCVRHHGGRLTE